MFFAVANFGEMQTVGISVLFEGNIKATTF